MSAFRLLPRAAAVLALLGGAWSAHANVWSTVASAGTVDDNDLAIAELINGEARLRAAAPVGSLLNIRYNIVQLPGFDGPGSYTLRVRYRDNGAGGRVSMNLRRYNTTGTTTQVAAFDSNAFAPNVAYQVRERCINVDWDFNAGAYFLDVELAKTAAAGAPALALVQLVPRLAICPVIAP